MPLIITNPQDEIVFGIDYYMFLKETAATVTDVIELELSHKEGLLLNYNMKDKFTGVNLYEKLLFVKKILPLANREEIYGQTNLDITIDKELEKKLDRMLAEEFQAVLAAEQVTLKTALQLCNFDVEDRRVLLTLFATFPFTSSQQLRVLEMVEEVLFRDKCGIAEVFEKIHLAGFLETEKPQKAIIEALFRFRNPLYTETEAHWQTEIKKLALPAHMQITHAPFFEKQQMELTIRLNTPEELKKFLTKITISPS